MECTVQASSGSTLQSSDATFDSLSEAEPSGAPELVDPLEELTTLTRRKPQSPGLFNLGLRLRLVELSASALHVFKRGIYSLAGNYILSSTPARGDLPWAMQQQAKTENPTWHDQA